MLGWTKVDYYIIVFLQQDRSSTETPSLSISFSTSLTAHTAGCRHRRKTSMHFKIGRSIRGNQNKNSNEISEKRLTELFLMNSNHSRKAVDNYFQVLCSSLGLCSCPSDKRLENSPIKYAMFQLLLNHFNGK